MAFGVKDTPNNELESSLDYSNNTFPSTISHSKQSEIKRTVDYNFLLTHTINAKTSFNLLANYVFGHNNSKHSYLEEDIDIINNAKEDSHYVMLSPQFVWTINGHNSLVAYMFWEYIGNHVQYSGDSPSDQYYYLWGPLTGVRYVYHREKWQAGTQVGCSYARTGLEGYPVSTDIAPKGNVFATYAPNQKNQFELFYGFGKNIPGIYQKSPNMLQQDRLMWYTGNPDLKSYWDNWVSLTYTWLPNNIWQLNATGDYFISSNRLVLHYSPTGPEGTMLRRYMNNGDFRRVRVGVTGTGKFLSNQLVAKVSPMLYLQSTTGTYAMRKNILTCSAQLTWYFGNFYLFGWYNTPSTCLEINSGIKIHSPSQYRIQLGWGKGNWKASATASNFLRRNWIISDQQLSSESYRYDNTNYGISMHQRFQIEVTYTFNYGKKVQSGNEVGAATTNQSAILK